MIPSEFLVRVSPDGQGFEATIQPAPDLRPFRMQDGPPIPWFVAEAIYRFVYRHTDQGLERLDERGGFGWGEVKFMWSEPKLRTTPEQRKACTTAVRSALTAAPVSRGRGANVPAAILAACCDAKLGEPVAEKGEPR